MAKMKYPFFDPERLRLDEILFKVNGETIFPENQTIEKAQKLLQQGKIDREEVKSYLSSPYN